jgi:hypothetical protein
MHLAAHGESSDFNHIAPSSGIASPLVEGKVMVDQLSKGHVGAAWGIANAKTASTECGIWYP